MLNGSKVLCSYMAFDCESVLYITIYFFTSYHTVFLSLCSACVNEIVVHDTVSQNLYVSLC